MVSRLTPDQYTTLKRIRDSLPAPTQNTVMQKLLGPAYFDKSGNLVFGRTDDYLLGKKVRFDGGYGPAADGGSMTVGTAGPRVVDPDRVLQAKGVNPVAGGPGVGSGVFDKWGITSERSTLVLVEERGGTATLSPSGRLLADGTRVPQGSTAYMMDVARNDPTLLDWLADPVNTDVAHGLADGKVGVRYVLATSPGDGTTIVKDLVVNPDHVDWSWLSSGR